jgi:hypothetical protein
VTEPVGCSRIPASSADRAASAITDYTNPDRSDALGKRMTVSRRDSDAGYFTDSFVSGGRTDVRSSSLRSWGLVSQALSRGPGFRRCAGSTSAASTHFHRVRGLSCRLR